MIDPEAREAAWKAADDITEFIGSGPCVAWIGSGLSMPAYPSWDDAIAEVCRKCLSQADGPTAGDPGKLMSLADECREENPKLYSQTLGELFGHVAQNTRSAYSYICNSPFAGFVTTNFDPLLYLAAGNRRISIYPNIYASALEKNSVVYLHGIAYKPDGSSDGSDLVFSLGEFEKAYKSSFLPYFLMMNLGSTNTLFVGCRLAEEYIQSTFAQIRNIYDKSEHVKQRKRVILLPAVDDANKAEEEQRSMAAAGIEIIRYPQVDQSHAGLDQVLERVWNNLRKNTIDEGKDLPG
jgi:hypothetical protein